MCSVVSWDVQCACFNSVIPPASFLLYPITLGSHCSSGAILPPLHYPDSVMNTWMGLSEPLLGSTPSLWTSRNWTKFYSYCKPVGTGLALLGASLVTDISEGSTASIRKRGDLEPPHCWYLMCWKLNASCWSFPSPSVVHVILWAFRDRFVKKTFSFLVAQGIPICWNFPALSRYLFDFCNL